MEKKALKQHEPRPARSSGVAPKKRPSINQFLEMAPLFDQLVDSMGGAFAVRFADERLHSSPNFQRLALATTSTQTIPLQFDECDASMELLLPDEKQRSERLAQTAALAAVSMGIIHDLRNVLASLMCYFPQAKEKLSEADPETADIVHVLDEAIHAGIDICMRSERLMCPQKQFQAENIYNIVESAIRLTKSCFRGKDITIANNLDENTVAKVYAGDLQLALMNIFINASEHGIEKQGTIQITARQIEDYVYLHVQNDGLPIPEEVRSHMFSEPLSHACNNGYGLYVSARNIRNFGGDIDFASDEDRTIFILKLPAKRGGEHGK